MLNLIGSLSIVVLTSFTTMPSQDDLGIPLPSGAVLRLGSQSMRQSGGVNALLFVGNDSRLLAAGTSGAIHSWDPVTGALMGRFGINSRSIVSLMKTPDEQTFFATALDEFMARFRRGDLERPEEMRAPGMCPVVSPTLDRICVVAEDLINFALLDIEGKPVKRLESKGMRAVEATFSDDGSLLALSSVLVPEGKSKAQKQPVVRIVKVHAEEGQDEVRTLNLPDGLFFKRVRFLPDNRRLVAAGIDGVVRVIDIEDSIVETTAKFSVESASSMALSSDASLVAVGDAAGSVSVFAVDGLAMIQNVVAHKSPVNAVAFSSDGARLATGGSDSTIRVFEVASGETLTEPKGHDAQVACIATSRDGSTIATGTYSGMLHLWDGKSGAERYRVRANEGAINRVAITSNGDTVITGGQDGNITLFDSATGEEKKRIAVTRFAIMDFTLAPDDTRLFASCGDNRLRVFDLTTGETTLDVDATSQSMLFSVAATRDGAKIAFGASAIRFVDAKGEKLLDIVDCRAPVLTMAFSPDETELVAGLADGSIRVYQVESGKELRRTQFGSGRLRRIVVSPDGSELIACSETENAARSFTFATLEKLREFDGHVEPVFDVAYCGVDRMVTASADTTALVWKR